jgi:23S rRNA (uracil1939-C5)-methyltransferase
LFENPLTTLELNAYDVVVLDPPRAGARSQVLELFKSNVPLIVYVSCNPESFKKDTEILRETYDLAKVTPVDQFVWSAHLELVGVFKKKDKF